LGIFVLWHRIRVKNIEAHRKELAIQVTERTREIADKNRQLESALQELKDAQSQLAQAEKMASLGNLAAGIAHEINSPVGAVKSAANTSQRSMEKVVKTLEESRDLEEMREDQNFRKALEILRNNNDIIVMGSERINHIIHSLRNFARLEEADFQEADIHEGIKSTLTLLHHKMKNRVRVVREFGDIPKIQCYPNQLNQVFMNMLANASQAIEGEGTITIRTSISGAQIVVLISDDGKGIRREDLKRVFDPGFTTKGVGVGTGLGLSISYNIIKNHNGEIKVESEQGKGTDFTITLPIKQEEHSTPIPN
jgi:signal transduction histidine kinase